MGVDAREFVRIWQTAACIQEVARKARATVPACRVREKRYRAMGIPLKELEDGRLVYRDELRDFAQSLLPKEEAAENSR
jgi:hypothetical protein